MKDNCLILITVILMILTILIAFAWDSKKTVEYNGVWENVIDTTQCNEKNMPKNGKE